MRRLLIPLFFLACPSWAAIAFVGTASLGNNGGSGNLTASYTVGSGSNRILWVTLGGDTASDNVSAVTYAGVSMTQVLKHAPGATVTRWSYLYCLAGPTSGANNVVATSSGGFVLGTAVDYSGASQTCTPNATQSQDATCSGSCDTNPVSVTVTTTVDNCWIVSSVEMSGATLSVVSGGTVRSTESFNLNSSIDSNQVVTPAGSYTIKITNAGTMNTEFITLAAAFAPVSGRRRVIVTQ